MEGGEFMDMYEVVCRQWDGNTGGGGGRLTIVRTWQNRTPIKG